MNTQDDLRPRYPINRRNFVGMVAAGAAGLADGIVVTPSHNPPRTAASSTTRLPAAPPIRT